MTDPVQAKAGGDIDGVNVDFTTPSAYIPGSLWAYLNGQLIDRDADDGPTETGGNTFRLRKAPIAGDVVHVWYWTTPSSASSYPVPPRGLWALDLVPENGAALDLVPDGLGSENLSADGETPIGHVALDLVPSGGAALDLVPRPISAEEV